VGWLALPPLLLLLAAVTRGHQADQGGLQAALPLMAAHNHTCATSSLCPLLQGTGVWPTTRCTRQGLDNNLARSPSPSSSSSSSSSSSRGEPPGQEAVVPRRQLVLPPPTQLQAPSLHSGRMVQLP
jgi:hypothetical protein